MIYEDIQVDELFGIALSRPSQNLNPESAIHLALFIPVFTLRANVNSWLGDLPYISLIVPTKNDVITTIGFAVQSTKVNSIGQL